MEDLLKFNELKDLVGKSSTDFLHGFETAVKLFGVMEKKKIAFFVDAMNLVDNRYKEIQKDMEGEMKPIISSCWTGETEMLEQKLGKEAVSNIKKYVLDGNIEELREDFPVLYENLYEFYAFGRGCEGMPYGTAKAKTGDPDQWLQEHLELLFV